MSDRFFTIESSEVGEKGGRYKSPNPLAAAKKAARRVFGAAPAGRKSARFAIRETTIGSEKGSFYYTATKVDLEKPIVVKRGDVEIVIKSKYDVKACGEF